MDKEHRKTFLIDFYSLLDELAEKSGSPTPLSTWGTVGTSPMRGVYFFFEAGEERSDTGSGTRVVRTHALKDGAKSILSGRLKQHRGQLKTGGGNHRGSIFRFLPAKRLLPAGRRAHASSDSVYFEVILKGLAIWFLNGLS